MHKAVRAKVAARVMLALVLLLASGTLLGGGYVARAGVPAQISPNAAQPASKVSPEVQRATANGQVAPIAILLADQADLSAAYSITDRNARGRYVYNTLKAHADRTQVGVKAELSAAGVPYSSYWVANVIFSQGDRALVEKLAARSDVKLVDSNASRRVIDDPVSTGKETPLSPEAIEWNVTRVNAPQVWDLGYRGEGIVIGINDTGVKWDHPALKPQYRGWNGITADHSYNWHDSIDHEPCPPLGTVPCDPYGHGTHVTGIAVGDDHSGNQIGVAPGARWIGCRSMDNSGDGTPQTYTECLEFFMAPTDINGQNPNSDLRPHVVNNSWGCEPGEGCTQENINILKIPVENAQAAGIFIASSVGNSGPSCSSVKFPLAIYEATFATGATDINDTLANFSSRGPYTPTNTLKPNISAPGSNIRSALNNNGYGGMSGTSMASPHVAGSIALLWNVWPDLQRDITGTKTLLQQTADPGVTVPNNQTCGGTPPSTIPNNMFGYGLVDAYAAVLAQCGNGPITQDVQAADELSPGSITIPAGSTIRWSSYSDTHTSTSDTGLWDSGDIPPGQSFSHTFMSPGTYTYHCEVHPNMTGTINVVNGCPSTATPTSTATPSSTSTNTGTATSTPTSTSTAANTGTSTSTLTGTATSSSTATSAATSTVTPSNTATATRTATNSAIATATTAAETPTPCATTVDVSLGRSGQASGSRPSGVCPPGPSPSPTPTSTSCAIEFADVPATGEGSTFYSFVRCLACRHIVGGYPCGGPGEGCNGSNDPYFRPGANVTRGQIAKMVALVANLSGATGEQIFEDVAPGSTFYDPIQQLASRGYIGGYTCGGTGEPCVAPANRPYFRPSANATRGQLSKIVSETAQFSEDPGAQIFTDVPANSTFFDWVNRLAKRDVISGYACGGAGEPCDAESRPYFRPGANVTRGQTAKIVANTFFPNCQTPARP